MNKELRAALDLLNKQVDTDDPERIVLLNAPWTWKEMKTFVADVPTESVCPGRSYSANIHGEQHIVRIVATLGRKRFMFKVIE